MARSSTKTLVEDCDFPVPFALPATVAFALAASTSEIIMVHAMPIINRDDLFTSALIII